jgi:hypothetical protein
MRRDQRTHRTPAPARKARATSKLPTNGFALIVDGHAKAEFEVRDQVLKAATDLKQRFPLLQVKIYNAENGRSENIKLAVA